MLDFLIDSIFFSFEERVLKKMAFPWEPTVPLFLPTCSYIDICILGRFIQELLKKKEKNLAVSFNFTFLYI